MFKDLAIVVHTMDKYEFCWEGWYKTFKQNWDFNLGVDIYFANEQKDINFDGIHQLKTDIGEWSDRLNRAFNMIPHKHVMYWQEDMWMLSKLNNFTQYYRDFVKYDMDHLMFLVKLKIKKESYFPHYDEIHYDNYLKFIIEKTPFVIFHQPGIWKKDFFLEYLQHSEDPWENEIEGTVRAKKAHKIKEINTYNVNQLDYWYTPVVKKGKFSPHAKKVFNGTFIPPIIK